MNEVRVHVEGIGAFRDRTMRVARWLDSGAASTAAADISFESKEGLLRVLTPNRWALLRKLRTGGSSSIRALAKALERDYRGVHADVATLIGAGLIVRDNTNSISVPWSRITAEMALEIAA